MRMWCDGCNGMVSVGKGVVVCRHCGGKLITMAEWDRRRKEARNEQRRWK